MKVYTIKFQNKFLKISFACILLTDPRKSFAFFSLSHNNLIKNALSGVRERRGWDELRVALTYMHYYVQSRQLEASCYRAQGAQLSALRSGMGVCVEGRLKREGIHGNIQLIHIVVQQKLTL